MIREGADPQLLRHHVLGSDTLYRVVDVSGDLVEVEVVSAPGLQPGTHLRLTQSAVAGMSVVPDGDHEHVRQDATTENPAAEELQHHSIAE
jgi:hypothetical protein